MIRAETRFTPEMSTTEYIIVTSTAPTYGRVSPDASVETMQLRHADGQRAHRTRRDRRAARAAERDDAVEAPVGVQLARRPLRRRAPSPSTAAPRSPAAASCGDVGTAGARDLVARDVGLEPDGLVHAGVDDEHVDAVLAQPVAEERVLAPLRVERAEQTTVATTPRSASGSTPRNRRCSSVSDDSSAAVVSA